MHMTYSSRLLWLASLAPTFALLACDGDLGKDDAADTGPATTGGNDGDDGGGEAGQSSTSPGSGSAGGTGAADSGDDGGSGTCTDEECGPAPGAPSMLCPDGVNQSGPGPCERNAEGVCGWTFLECPPCCDPAMQPDCPEPINCCGDGSWVCGEAAACPNAEAGLACDDGGTTDDGGTSGGEVCVEEQGSCAAGETCCMGLTCCAGVPVPPGQEFCGMECPMSDMHAKENFAPVDVRLVLDKVRGLDIMTWNYKTSPIAVRHLGPMAQEFKAAFEVGSTDKAIFQVDADGVALASIQALDAEVTALRTENAELRKALADLTKRVDAMR
jgi:hypothetical protein